MAPIQSRRSRKLRETAYVNGQHNNVLKEITTAGRDGTVPLLNFLENTERFIADTNILYSRVNQLERDQEILKNMGKKMNAVIAYLEQMTEALNTILPEPLEFDLSQEELILSETVDMKPADYFKPNETKRLEHPFPNFSNEHVIKINIGSDVVLMDVETPDIHMLASGRAKKGTIEMIAGEEMTEEPTSTYINTLTYNGTRKNRYDLPITVSSIEGEPMAQTDVGILKKYEGFRRNKGLYEIEHFGEVDEQLIKDSEKVEQLLRKLKRHSSSSSSLMHFAREVPIQDAEHIRYELEDSDDDDARTYTVTNIREELLSKRRSRRNYQGLPLTKPAVVEQDVVKLATTYNTPDVISKSRRRGTQRNLNDSNDGKKMLIIHEKEQEIQSSNPLIQRLKHKSHTTKQPLVISSPPVQKDVQLHTKTKAAVSTSLLGRNKARSMKLRELQKHNEEMNAILDEEMRELDQIRQMLMEDD